jgi:hypothetical protein
MTLETLEQRERIGLDRERARAVRERAEALLDMVHRGKTTCPVCGERLGTSRGVLFQGDELVHAGCWAPDRAHPELPPPRSS